MSHQEWNNLEREKELLLEKVKVTDKKIEAIKKERAQPILCDQCNKITLVPQEEFDTVTTKNGAGYLRQKHVCTSCGFNGFLLV